MCTERTSKHRCSDGCVVCVIVVFVTHSLSVFFTRVEAACMGVCMIGDDCFEDGVGEEVLGGVIKVWDDCGVPLRGEEG